MVEVVVGWLRAVFLTEKTSGRYANDGIRGSAASDQLVNFDLEGLWSSL
jgi:hypothetical protein